MSPQLPEDSSGDVVPIKAVAGTVKKSAVLRVLRNNGVSVTDDGDKTILSKGEICEVYYFPPSLNRRMLHTLARKYVIPVHYFYHPDLSSRKR